MKRLIIPALLSAFLFLFLTNAFATPAGQRLNYTVIENHSGICTTFQADSNVTSLISLGIRLDNYTMWDGEHSLIHNISFDSSTSLPDTVKQRGGTPVINTPGLANTINAITGTTNDGADSIRLVDFFNLTVEVGTAGAMFNYSVMVNYTGFQNLGSLGVFRFIGGSNCIFATNMNGVTGTPELISDSGTQAFTNNVDLKTLYRFRCEFNGRDIKCFLENATNVTIIDEISSSGRPEITFYNLTSEGGTGCTNWNTDKSNACTTSDTTPTIYVNTTENGFCAIGKSDLNYTDLGDGRQCLGGTTTNHTCTLLPQDQLTEEISYVYIGCKNNDGNQNLTSTSGALKMSVPTSIFENAGRFQIEQGISKALPTGYTLYTDQKIYARNSANNQSTGIFDKVAKWMNNIWAFNYLTGNDTAVGMFNVTPVLYASEMTNVTNSSINASVYDLITNTK